MRRLATLPLLLVLACATTAPAVRSTDPIPQINAMLDDWHDAAADADEARYFGAMAPEFVFLGTDAIERWEMAAFRTFAHPYFAKGTAWTFLPRHRHVILSPAADVAWFDEKLDSATYGECRGTGVVRLVEGTWRVAQYNLTIPIPNDLAKTVVGMIREKK